MFSEFRLSLRSLAKSPGFTAVAVLTLALGIGLSTSAFSISNAFLFRLLPYPDCGSLVRIFRTASQGRTLAHSPGTYMDLREFSTSFSSIAGFSYDLSSIAETGQPARQAFSINVAPNFLSTLRVQPSLGRDFSADDDQAGKNNVIIITDRLWANRFNRDPQVLGRTLRINGDACTIIGVLPKSFDAPLLWGTADFIRPLGTWAGFRTARTDKWMGCVARLKPGVTLAASNVELGSLAARLEREYPKEDAGDGFSVVPLHSSNMDNTSRNITWLMTGLALMVLVIACSNLASLLLARALGRTREFAIRSALGASRFRLMSPLLTESLVLAIAGGALGLLFASWSNAIIGAKLLISNEPGFAIPIDGNVLLFAIATSLGTTLVFGLAPAVLISRAPAADSLKDGARGSSAGRSHHRFKCSLVVGEIALALVLVGVSASFAIASKTFLHRNLGWNPEGVYQGFLNRPWNRYGTDDQRRAFDRSFLEKLAALPGVENACIAYNTPLYSYFGTKGFLVEGQPAPARGKEPLVESNSVSPDFFKVLGIPLKQGSLFAPSLRAEDPPAALVNESLARHFWPNENPVGRRIKMVDKDEWLQVVGVVGDVRMAANISAPSSRFQVYRPLIQTPANFITFAVRSTVPPESLGHSIEQLVASIDPDLPISQAGAAPKLIETALSNLDIVVYNLATFAVMGLLIAAIGIYGVISHLTAQRTLDIGVRIALGAREGQIVRMILVQGTQLLAIGLVIGVVGAYFVDAFLRNTVPEMGLPGSWIQGLTVLALSLVTLLACYLPARRASLIDPVIALRGE